MKHDELGYVRTRLFSTVFLVLVPSNLPSPSRSFAPGCTFSFFLLFPALHHRQTRDSTHRSVMRIRSFTHKVYLFQHFRCIKCVSKYRSKNRRRRDTSATRCNRFTFRDIHFFEADLRNRYNLKYCFRNKSFVYRVLYTNKIQIHVDINVHFIYIDTRKHTLLYVN